MLLKTNAHQLTARPDARLREELLKCSLERALRYSDLRRNLFTRKPISNTQESTYLSRSVKGRVRFSSWVPTGVLRAVCSWSWFRHTLKAITSRIVCASNQRVKPLGLRHMHVHSLPRPRPLSFVPSRIAFSRHTLHRRRQILLSFSGTSVGQPNLAGAGGPSLRRRF